MNSRSFPRGLEGYKPVKCTDEHHEGRPWFGSWGVAQVIRGEVFEPEDWDCSHAQAVAYARKLTRRMQLTNRLVRFNRRAMRALYTTEAVMVQIRKEGLMHVDDITARLTKSREAFGKLLTVDTYL